MTDEIPTAWKCPICHELIDKTRCVYGLERLKLQEGDYCVCLYCGAVIKFEKGNKMRRLGDLEITQLPKPIFITLRQWQDRVRARNN